MAKSKAENRILVPEETAMFCEQVALVLKSGIPLFDGLSTLCDSYKESRYADRFAEIDRQVKANGSLHAALESVGIFPSYMVRMVRVGEASGKLDDVMDGLAAYYARDGKIRASIKSAIIYPVVLVLMMAIVIAVLVSQVLPIFDRVFRNLGTEMNASMTAVMNFGMITGYAVLGIVAVLLIALVIGYVLFRTGHRAGVMRFVTRLLPPIRRVTEKTSSGRFASVLSMMLSAGFPIEEAITMAGDVMTDERMRAKAKKCAEDLNEHGVELPKAIADAELFDPLYNKMIQVGYYAGQMDRVMSKISEIYEEEIDDSIRRLVGMIEPTLVGVLAVIIGAILLAVMLPLASIMSSIL